MEDKEINLGIGLPLVDEFSRTAFWDSFYLMQKPEHSYLRPRMPCHPNVEEIRNSLCMQALEMNCSHLLMMDTDQVYPVDTVTRLLEHARSGLDLVYAKVHRRYPPFDPILLRKNGEGYLPIPDEEWDAGGLVEVDRTGAGCMLISCSVFENVEWPWFNIIREPVGEGKYKLTGEDFYFCDKVRAAGYRIFVDCSLEIVHDSTLGVSKGTYFLYKKLDQLKKGASNGARQKDR